MAVAALSKSSERLRLDLAGVVQGVGFRPFVFRLANAEGIGGFVRNTGDGVTLEIEGLAAALKRFLARLDLELPPHAEIHRRQIFHLAPSGEADFRVLPSKVGASPWALVMPDLATCHECLREIFDPTDGVTPILSPPASIADHATASSTPCPTTACARRCSIFRSVSHAGPSMKTLPRAAFTPNLLPARIVDRDWHCGIARARSLPSELALAGAVTALREGLIVAIKGLGGFQLLGNPRQ